jgi:hypothetical protein
LPGEFGLEIPQYWVVYIEVSARIDESTKNEKENKMSGKAKKKSQNTFIEEFKAGFGNPATRSDRLLQMRLKREAAERRKKKAKSS